MIYTYPPLRTMLNIARTQGRYIAWNQDKNIITLIWIGEKKNEKKIESDSHNVDPLHMTSKWRKTSKFKHSTEQIMNENSIVYKQFFSTKSISANRSKGSGVSIWFGWPIMHMSIYIYVEQCHMSHIIHSMQFNFAMSTIP